MLDFYNTQVLPSNDPRYEYGLLKFPLNSELELDTAGDAGLVDHLFLLFGLVENAWIPTSSRTESYLVCNRVTTTPTAA